MPHWVNVRTERFRWQGAVHNHLITLKGQKKRSLRKDVWIIYHPEQGEKSHGLTTEQKYLRDAKLLLEDLALHPDNARSQIYLGQSYRDAGPLEKELKAYARRTTLAGWDQEKFVAQLEVGRLAIRLEHSEQKVLGILLAAYELMPNRAEPLYELARYFRQKQNYAKAFVFARAAADAPMPDEGLFVSRSIYDWRLLDELSVAAYWLARHEVCESACQQILARVDSGVIVSSAELNRVRANLKFAQIKLAQE